MAGSSLVSSSDDGTCIAWDLQTATPLLRFEGGHPTNNIKVKKNSKRNEC